ncbi:MAG TPA: diguanylate cyclase [Herpetosiphonaceae bacterium]
MELRAYLSILRRKWWIVLLTLTITYAATLYFTFTQAPLYESSATFVVKLSPAFRNDKDLAAAVDILSRRTEIGTTFTQVADSRLIKQLAASELGLTSAQRGDVSITSQLIPGTNVLKISTQAHDRVLARNMTNAVGVKTVAYVQDLYETYKLEPLDRANSPSTPISPNKPLNLALGGIMGLVLGAGFALLSAYLQAPGQQIVAFNILDQETEVYNRRYFELRLRQEIARSRRNSAPLTLALINIDRQQALAGLPAQLRHEALRRVALLLAAALREEDVLARFDDTTFAVLLLDTPAERAIETMSQLQARLTAMPLELAHHDATLNLQALVGCADYRHPDIKPEELVGIARRALQEAEAAARGTVYPVLPNLATYQLSMAKGADHE